jgi:nucleotide-binding universal stress UspA family protein
MIQLKNILLPTDFSDSALQATRYALELAKRFGARLHLLHVIEDPFLYLPIFDSSPRPSRDEFERYAQERLENWILPSDAEGVELVFRWVHGPPFVRILEDAREHDVDLIIVGTHGHGLAHHLLVGSVAERVVRKAPCPVLTVRPEGHQFIHPGVEATVAANATEPRTGPEPVEPAENRGGAER